ncbi:hypothetical protein LG293_08385 [Citricoccus nitrophenolicus]|uniref:Uncharacterized protein n=1 Tax=Citricoccus muralis TaxID=169134 RepID=A0A3D9LFW7_9MICC|nr:hypothetical protein [Citricoccus muralis]REE05052.1 hypothetical protein C8E99_2911 [Citricoccus muralis]
MTESFGWFADAPLSGQTFAPPPPLAARPLFAVASAAAFGGLSLVEPRPLGSGARAAYRITTAALTGAYTAAILPAGTTAGMPARYMGGPRGQFVPLCSIGRGSAALAAGGLMLGLADPLEALDARITGWLTEHGVRNPRWWMAGVGVAVVAAGWAADRAELRSLQSSHEEARQALENTDENLGLADPAMTAVLDALLQPGVTGVEALRVQLDSVQQRDAEAGFMTDAYLAVGEETPRIAPRTQVWPVKARFQRGEAAFEIELQIHEGRLESLAIMLAEEPSSPGSEVDQDEAINSLTAWPAVEELDLVTETADPLT